MLHKAVKHKNCELIVTNKSNKVKKRQEYIKLYWKKGLKKSFNVNLKEKKITKKPSLLILLTLYRQNS